MSGGDVAIEHGTTLGDLQSPVIDRAALLQKSAAAGEIRLSGDMTASALIVLGQLQPATDAVAGEAAFAWKVGSGGVVGAPAIPPYTQHPPS